MSKVTANTFTSVLLSRKLIRAADLAEAEQRALQGGLKLPDALVQLGYLTTEQILQAQADFHGLPFIDLSNVTVPSDVIEIVPESVARENIILPLAGKGSVLFVVVSDPTDTDLLQKLQFIFNRDIQFVVAVREQIIEAINRHYGQSETESVDSFLLELTDTAIDFTQVPAPGAGGAIELARKERRGTGPAVAEAAPPERLVGRQATVRYYHRVNPDRMVPLLVVLSQKEILEVVKRDVAQAASARFEVALDSVVEVEPILPGCSCYPPKEQVAIRAGEVSTTFWVVPHVLGQVMQARVAVRQGGKVLAEVPLQVRVVKQGLTVLLGALSLVLPLLLLLLKQLHLDFESQLQDGFGLYAQMLQWAIASLSPELLGGLLLVATAAAYLWLRPRRRDVFWDIETHETNDESRSSTDATAPAAGSVEEALPAAREAFFREAEAAFVRQDYPVALDRYERGLRLARARPGVYFRASLAAFHLGDYRRALAILEEASANLHPSQVSGAMWYNMGCGCARLGRFAEAIRYLNRAADAGHVNPAKLRSDPDLAPLRWRDDFKRLLHSLQEC